MSLPSANRSERFTYADYLTWPDDERWEIIDGVAYAMSPAPGKRHQQVSGELFRQVANFLRGKPCRVFAAPFDVRFSEQAGVSDNYIDTVVQPDLLVVCDTAKLDERGCNGAPDLVIEILSPATVSRDLKDKFELYERHGVLEYWIMYPTDQTLLVYKREADGMFGKPGRYAAHDKVQVSLLGDLVVDLGEVFAE